MKRSLVCAIVTAALAAVLAAAAAPAAEQDWPQWRGPTRDGVAATQKWSWQWPAEGPTRLWRVNIGEGYASPIISGGRVFTFGRVSEKGEGKKFVELVGDCVHALDAQTGKVLWRTKVGDGRGEFALTTPCTDGKLVFSITHDGNVTALDAQTGTQAWQVNIVKEYKTTRGGFHGIANSPLLVGNALVLSQGVGLDKNTGKLLWQNADAMTGSHASPVLCPAGDQPGVLVYGKLLTRLDPATGKTLWQQDKIKHLGQGYMDPIVLGDRILVLDGAGRNRFGFTAAEITEDNQGLYKPDIYGYCGAGDMANPVVWQGHVYCQRTSSGDRSGMFADNPDLSMSTLQCFDLATLKLAWSKPGINGTPIVCDGKLILQGQYGEIRVIEATPAGYKELAKARVSEPRSGSPKGPFGRASFATPALVNGRLYCRWFTGELICLDVSKDYPNPDPDAVRRRIVGEVITVTGTLAPKPGDAPDYVVGILTEDGAAATQAASVPKPAATTAPSGPKTYTLCAQKHNDNPGALDKIAGFVDKKARVALTGTLLYDDQLSVNKIEPAN